MRELMDAGRRDLARAGRRDEDRDPGCRRRRRLFRRAAGGRRQRRHLHRPRCPCRRDARAGPAGAVAGGRPASPAGQAARGLAHHRAGRHRPGRGQDVRPRRRGGDHQAAAGRSTPPSCRSRTASRRRRSSSGGWAGATSVAVPPTSRLRSRRRASSAIPARAPASCSASPTRPSPGGSRPWRPLAAGRGSTACCRPRSTVEVWRKFVFLAPFAGITCFGRTTIGAVREDPLLWRRFMAMVEEAIAVARALRRRLAGGRGGASASSSPASCRPR